ncbi:MAG TPA: hypothetical protein VFZ93_07235 [Albitalea sp.]
MTRSPSLLDRLRTSRPLRAWLVVLALASVLSGLHAALHIGGAFASVAASSSAPAGGDGDGRHGDCPLCRLASSWTLALAPALLVALLLAWVVRAARRAPGFERGAVDSALRWCQQRKHGPPAFSR